MAYVSVVRARKMMVMKLIAGIIAMSMVSGAYAAKADDSIPGKYEIARRHPKALVIWNSAPVIMHVLSAKLSDADACKLLQRDALRIIMQTQTDLDDSQAVTVRIIFPQMGDASNEYKVATFIGVERFAEVTLDRSQIDSDLDHWKEAASGSAPLPAFTQPKILGSLPPR